ncbi:MAG: hypothetical protein ACK4UO_06745 [Pseudolabrys sp.]
MAGGWEDAGVVKGTLNFAAVLQGAVPDVDAGRAAALRDVYLAACAELAVEDADDPQAAEIARALIALAVAGVRDADALRRCVVAQFRDATEH